MMVYKHKQNGLYYIFYLPLGLVAATFLSWISINIVLEKPLWDILLSDGLKLAAVVYVLVILLTLILFRNNTTFDPQNNLLIFRIRPFPERKVPFDNIMEVHRVYNLFTAPAHRIDFYIKTSLPGHISTKISVYYSPQDTEAILSNIKKYCPYIIEEISYY